jgi:hypothetical protein
MFGPVKRQKLIQLAKTLLDQESARIVIQPNKRETGYWFGGGNLAVAPDGTWYLTGRYRNYGDSRTGLQAGLRGVELAVFTSSDHGLTFSKVLSFSKSDLSYPDRPVLSIEGSALHFTPDGVELFFSTEKENVPYPENLRSFHKSGTGVWSIDRLAAKSIHDLPKARMTPLLSSADPRFLHVKDPVVYDMVNGATLLSFCTHPFNWTSSNSGYVRRYPGAVKFSTPDHLFFRRGFTWDVAISRITAWLRVPQRGVFAPDHAWMLAFYDGGESMRNLEPHQQAIQRPRGYSCEEIGGLALASEDDLSTITRLSVDLPMFISPWGSGSSRYVDVLQTAEGLYATWEQSQPDFSQPLVMRYLGWGEVDRLLA